MKLYLPNNSGQQLSGGFTFLRVFRKFAQRAGVMFVNDWRDADGVLVAGATVVDVGEIQQAARSGIPVVYRVGNVPRKSRNKRSTPHERMKELASVAEVVVHQSEWSRKYCMPLVGDGPVIYNGADTDLFWPSKVKPDRERWLFAYHGKNETKSFWTAHLLFQQRFRENPEAEFLFTYDFGSELDILRNGNFDFWNGEKFEYLPKITEADEMADLMRQCTHLVHPAVADACPNTIVEARACGLEVVGVAPAEYSGSIELLDPNLDIGAERMVAEYLGLFGLVDNMTSQQL